MCIKCNHNDWNMCTLRVKGLAHDQPLEQQSHHSNVVLYLPQLVTVSKFQCSLGTLVNAYDNEHIMSKAKYY
jgi:hypothetical protein